MGSIISKLDDILDEYGSFENYFKKDNLNKELSNNIEKLKKQKLDFNTMTFEQYNNKYK